MPADVAYDERLRTAAFDHLTRLLAGSPDETLASADINRFEFQGRPTPLVVQTGIWKPAVLDAALSIRTTYTPPSQPPPYADDLGDDGLVRYKWRGTDPQHSDNRALRTALQRSSPLVYFVGVDPGVYLARYPVWLVSEDPGRREFTVALDEGQRLADGTSLAASQREYIRRLTNLRLHQPIFRARVLRAYGGSCAICQLPMRPCSTRRTSFRIPTLAGSRSYPTGWRYARSTTRRTTATSWAFVRTFRWRCSLGCSPRLMDPC
jgi:putative restriction endonuclease